MGPVRGLIAAGLGLLVVLSACQVATVPKPPLQTQAVLPPAPPPPEPTVEETSTDVESFLAGTAVTRVDLSQGARVALLLPLSGRHARTGQALLNAAQIALFDIAGDRFTLVVRDTAGTPQGAQAALRSALMEGVHFVLGPLFATSVAAIAPEVRAAGLIAISFSNDRAVAGDGVFIMGLAPRPQVYRLMGFARSQGLTRFAVLAPRTPYGDAVVQALREATLRNGLELSKVVSYAPDAADLSAEVRLLGDYDARRRALIVQRKVRAARTDDASQLALKRLDKFETLGAPDFQAILLPTGGQRLQAIAPMLAASLPPRSRRKPMLIPWSWRCRAAAYRWRWRWPGPLLRRSIWFWYARSASITNPSLPPRRSSMATFRKSSSTRMSSRPPGSASIISMPRSRRSWRKSPGCGSFI